MIFADENEIISFATERKLPPWQEKLFKKHADAIQVHSQGQLFVKVNTLFPNEAPESKENRILSFESITEGSFGKAANNINRIFKNSSYTIEADERTLQFANDHNFEGQNLYSWFLDIWTKWALKEDANSRIVIYPFEYVKTGKPQIVFVPSDLFRWIDSETFVFVSQESVFEYTLNEKVVCEEVFYDQTVNRINARQAAKNTFMPKIEKTIKKYVWHVFQKGLGFYRIEQQKDQKEFLVDFIPFKNKDFFPVIDSGGEKGEQNINKSFLHPFVPFGNLALLQHSQHTAVNFMFSFPRMSEIETPCDHPNCQSGLVLCETAEDLQKFGQKKPCTRCGGTGGVTRQSPYKVYKKKFDPNLSMGDDAKYLDVDDVKYYTPDVSILDYSKNEWQNYLAMAETAVYIQQQPDSGNQKSAKSKEIDREDLYAFLSRVGQVFYSRLRFVLQSIEIYLLGKSNVIINIPFSYAILTENEAFIALNNILNSTVPLVLKAGQVESFINKFVSQSSPIKKFIDVLQLVDPLLYLNPNELQNYKISGAISLPAVTTHVYAFPVLQKIYYEDKNAFITQTPDQLAKKVADGITQYIPKAAPTTKEAIIAQTQSTPVAIPD